jgi:glycolate oxidase FAD binding subunit
MKPETVSDLCSCILDTAERAEPLEIRGGARWDQIGKPNRNVRPLDLSAFSGVVDYDPAELVITVGAATALEKVTALLHEHNQMLACEPDGSTIGGMVCAAQAGSRRLSAGGVRDYVLGFEAVSGRGDFFKAGGRVVKNVTGYDLPKLITGSWGQLAALTQVNLRVSPRPETQATLILHGLACRAANNAMTLALKQPADVAAAAYDPSSQRVFLRVEGFRPSVSARIDMLQTVFHATQSETIWHHDALKLWTPFRAGSGLPDGGQLWKITAPPASGADLAMALIAGLSVDECHYFMDWAGGLIWLQTPEDANALDIRAIAARFSARAFLYRAPIAVRQNNSARHPVAPGVTALSARVKAGFDPHLILDPDRF